MGKTKSASSNSISGKMFEALSRRGLLCLCCPTSAPGEIIRSSVIQGVGRSKSGEKHSYTPPRPILATEVLCGLNQFNRLFPQRNRYANNFIPEHSEDPECCSNVGTTLFLTLWDIKRKNVAPFFNYFVVTK